ncbi:MAG: hypothetical protein ACE37F_04750 [Nannocystaceae bacterium]|nr:hypothetical protein [bacterium]
MLFLLLFGCAHDGLPRKPWTRHTVGTVTFVSGANDRTTKPLLEAFSKFRVVTGAVTSASSVEPRVPTTVYLFPDQRTYDAHVGMKNSAGMFAYRGGQFTLALNAIEEGSQDLLFHEYTHLILANTGNRYPTWYDEGFAEVMATMRFVGDDVHLGRVAASNVTAVAQFNRWVPLGELLRGQLFEDRSDQERLHRHYSQAWLAVHYIQFGAPRYAERVGQYVALASETGDPLAAFEPAFGVSAPAFEKELRDYLRDQKLAFRVLPADQFAFPEQDFEPEVLTRARTGATLAKMSLLLGNEARAVELQTAVINAGEPDPLEGLR